MAHILARFMDDRKPAPIKMYPGGLCPDCGTPAVDHLDTSGMVDLGCPTPGQPMYLRQLAASAHIQSLATVLAVAHWKFEGWDALPLPLEGELKRIYEQAAEYAVRFCSEADRKVAEDRAVGYGRSLLGENPAMVTLLREVLDVYRHSLMHGTASPVEMVAIRESLDAE